MHARRRRWRCAVGTAATLVASLACGVVVVAAGPALNGGGSNFASPAVDQWRAEVARNPFDLTINYVAQGSSFGRQQFINGSLDFAVTDSPFTTAEAEALAGSARSEFTYVPVSADGLGFMYNLIDLDGQRVNDLNLTRRAVCRIFTEPGLRWDDPEIQQANPTRRLPHALVRPIVRQDDAGESYALSEFCLTVEPAVWSAFVERERDNPFADPRFVAGEPTTHWPSGWGSVGGAVSGDGVAAVVASAGGANSINYNSEIFARLRGFPNASVANQAGAFTQPTEAAVSAGLRYATGRPDGTFVLDYRGLDPDAYFPAVYSYAIAQTTGFPADKGEVLARFLCYAVTYGQRPQLTSGLGYASLSAELVAVARNAIAQIPGAPEWANCAVGDSPPPEIPEAPWAVLPVLTAAMLAGFASVVVLLRRRTASLTP